MLVTQDGLVLDITFELTASLLVAIVEVQEPIIIHASEFWDSVCVHKL